MTHASDRTLSGARLAEDFPRLASGDDASGCDSVVRGQERLWWIVMLVLLVFVAVEYRYCVFHHTTVAALQLFDLTHSA